ncbi:MAG TPA: imidazole glycerol phosphate synthase subunit HisH [Phycisphaerae bacterium]|nr:imidazole glycerol phosphate synthase subunit HisH [Phycisphaerae bacterium]
MIAILECETGDSSRLQKVFASFGADAKVVGFTEGLDRASKIVIPSGTSFRQTVRSVRDRGLVGPLLRAVEDGRAVLAVSLGMHLLMDVSYEEGQHTGLGAIHGKVARFDFGDHPAARHFVLPHQGWNQVVWSNGCPLLTGLHSGEYFYFDHSYHAEPLDERTIAARSNHGIDFAAVLWQGRVFATQFLPERSGEAGLKLLANFLAM